MGETDTRKIWGSQRRPELPPKSTTSLPASLEPMALLLLLLLSCLLGRPASLLGQVRQIGVLRMPGATIPPRRTDFKTASAKRCHVWRQEKKEKKARTAAAAAPQANAQAPGLVPDDPDYDSDLSDSGEAQFMRAARSPDERHHRSPSPLPPGHYRPCDATHPRGNCRLPPVRKPALGCELAANEGRRLFTMHEKALVHGELQSYRDRDSPDFSSLSGDGRNELFPAEW